VRKQLIRVGAVVLGAGLMGFAWAAPARAAMISYSHTTPSQSVPLTDTFLLNGFDPSLGTLTGVTLELDTNATAEVDVVNLSPDPGAFTNATASIPVTITGPASTSVTDTLMAGPISGTTTNNPGVTPCPGLPALDSNSTSVPSIDWSLYIGVGPIVPVTASSTTGTYSGSTASPNVLFGGSAVAGAVTTVTYTYTPTVPEPASIGLIALAFPLLAARRRRKA
jgi:hypothetical protein